MRIVNLASRILAWPLLAVVLFYQKTLSPDHGLLKPFYPWGYCKFYPTCSEYSAIVLRTQGVIGLPKIFKRLASCTPGSLGGVDWPYHG
jgi:putative component of membrane protein insertase Oxa1/YidC/SpoIIIJ protein YidD